MEELLKTNPTICLVADEYQFMIPVTRETLMWIEVGGELFYDESNGILRSSSMLHRISVPCSKLDRARAYTICCRPIVERKAYFTETEEERRFHYEFRPIAADARRIRVYHLADAHSLIDDPIRAASYWGDDLDLLVMNGDMVEDCRKLEYISAPYQISGAVTRGEIPVVYARGNHDLRGVLAEKYAEMTPSLNGNTYYTFRAGPIWGIVLDCGEDKVDDCSAYGHTICCQPFRQKETEYLKRIAASPKREYAAEGILGRWVVCHLPFPIGMREPFNIETERYAQWCRILKKSIRPDMMLCGHQHRFGLVRPGDEVDEKGAPCPVVIGSEVDEESNRYGGAAIEWTPEKTVVRFTDQNHRILRQEVL